MVYLDKTRFNLHTSAHYSYSPKNIEAVRMVSTNKGHKISLLSIISMKGIISNNIIEGPFFVYENTFGKNILYF